MLYHDCGGSYMTAYTLQNSSFKTGELREVGGGIGMGKTCEPKAFSFQCMTKFTTKKKKKLVNFIALHGICVQQLILAGCSKNSAYINLLLGIIVFLALCMLGQYFY